jgi:hypothetical protein
MVPSSLGILFSHVRLAGFLKKFFAIDGGKHLVAHAASSRLLLSWMSHVTVGWTKNDLQRWLLALLTIWIDLGFGFGAGNSNSVSFEVDVR